MDRAPVSIPKGQRAADATPLPGSSPSRQRPDATPLPLPDADPRMVDVWCTWLNNLATDAEAAHAAAMAYADLDAAARDRWLAALDQDAPRCQAPKIALYAPLLSVEADGDRRERIIEAIGPADSRSVPARPTRALVGRHPDGANVVMVVRPLYLDFVQVLACCHDEQGFRWVKHDPIVASSQAPRAGDRDDGVLLERAELAPVVDGLASAVLQHAKSGGEAPEALRVFADLFSPSFEDPGDG